MFRRNDPQFYDRITSWGGGIIVAGHNYGQGSAREHAALAPRFLGARVAEFAREAVDAGIDELALADTLGSPVPREVSERVQAVRDLSVPLRVHLHETRHVGLANALAALQAGVTVLDASAAGLGGCPFAHGAAGNVATEDLAWMPARSG